MIKTIEEIDAAIHAADNWIAGTTTRAWAIHEGKAILVYDKPLECVRQDSSVLP